MGLFDYSTNSSEVHIDNLPWRLSSCYHCIRSIPPSLPRFVLFSLTFSVALCLNYSQSHSVALTFSIFLFLPSLFHILYSYSIFQMLILTIILAISLTLCLFFHSHPLQCSHLLSMLSIALTLSTALALSVPLLSLLFLLSLKVDRWKCDLIGICGICAMYQQGFCSLS